MTDKLGKMSKSEELGMLKSIIENNAGNQDKDAMIQNVLNYIEKTKDETGDNEEQLLQKLLADLRTLYRPQATYYEYLLFLAVTAFIVSVFGESNISDRTRKIIQINTSKVMIVFSV